MTDDSLGADSGAATKSVEPAAHDGAFYDTSVLLDYALGQDDGAAADCLDDHRCENVTGETPRREFDGVVDRRERVVNSVLAADGLDDWTLPDDVELTSNDGEWLQELLGELQALADEGEIRAELIGRRDQLVRNQEELFKEPEQVIDHVAPNELDAQLVARLRGDGVSDNEDRHVVSEAAHWAVGADGDALVTTDENHMLSNQMEIATTVAQNRRLDSLTVCRPSTFLETDSESA
jgi:hypothetical protein